LKVLVTGATGFIGRHLAAAFTRAGHDVTAVVRAPQSTSDWRQIAGDFRHDSDPGDWMPRLRGIEAVVNTVGILRESRSQSFAALHEQAPKALFSACVRAGVRRVIQISALGAGVEADSRYHRSKGEADRFLASLPLEWTIVQPSLVFGAHGASTKLFYTLAALPIIPLPGDGMQQVQPVHIDDLVRVCLRLLEGSAQVRILPVVGPQVYTMRGLLAQARLGMNLPPPRFLRVPMPLLRAAARVPGVAFDAEALDMLARGSVAPLEPVRAIAGQPLRLPLLVRARAATAPHPIADWARLNALLPLLRAAVGVVWIVTGLVSLGLYPVAESYRLLAQVGIGPALAPWFLYGAAALDLALGIAVFGSRRRWLWRLQIGLILVYTAIISVALPQFWLHPFGPVLKNVPLVALLFALDVLERRA
jgi:uncharacterized protein YbjT (DUF2867 family)